MVGKLYLNKAVSKTERGREGRGREEEEGRKEEGRLPM